MRNVRCEPASNGGTRNKVNQDVKREMWKVRCGEKFRRKIELGRKEHQVKNNGAKCVEYLAKSVEFIE